MLYFGVFWWNITQEIQQDLTSKAREWAISLSLLAKYGLLITNSNSTMVGTERHRRNEHVSKHWPMKSLIQKVIKLASTHRWGLSQEFTVAFYNEQLLNLPRDAQKEHHLHNQSGKTNPTCRAATLNQPAVSHWPSHLWTCTVHEIKIGFI